MPAAWVVVDGRRCRCQYAQIELVLILGRQARGGVGFYSAYVLGGAIAL